MIVVEDTEANEIHRFVVVVPLQTVVHPAMKSALSQEDEILCGYAVETARF